MTLLRLEPAALPSRVKHSTTEPLSSHNMPLNEEIKVPITEAEIVKAAHSLKNNKSPGNDHILNEHIKTSLPLMLPIYEKLFNLVFDTAMIPES